MSEWIVWGGKNKCPVGEDVEVEVMFRGGDQVRNRAGDFIWGLYANDGDILAYRVCGEDQEIQPRILMPAAGFLRQAAKHMEDRASTYDKPDGERSMAQTTNIFNLYHGTDMTEAQGWHFMQILKDVRLFTRKEFHKDSAEDAIAYAALKAEAHQRKETAK